MRLPISAAVALTAALGASGAGIGAAAPPKPKNAPVIIEFADAPTDKIVSDGNPYQDGFDRVVAYIQASANSALIFSTNAFNLPGRTLQFLFDICLSGPCTPPYPGAPAPMNFLNERSGIVANALANPGGPVLQGGMLAMDVGEELPAFVKIDIPLDWDPAYWNVCFDSRDDASAPCSPPGANRTDARIQRNSASKWTIFANDTDRADLNRDSGSRRDDPRFTHQGTYSMPFSFTVQCMNLNDCTLPTP